MDTKLNPISNSAAGTPLTGQAVSTETGKQAYNSAKLERETIQDTLETSDREVDGRQAYETPDSPRKEPSQTQPTLGQGGLLDLEG